MRQALGDRVYTVMHSVVETLDYLTHLAKDKQAAEIYRILVSSKSEKTRDVLRVLDLEREAKEAAAADGKSEDGASASATEPDPAATKEAVPESAPTATPNPTAEDKPGGKNKRKGHGRNGAGDYTGARRIPVYLESMKAGDRCPCGMGNLYHIDASPLIRIVGQAPIHADIYHLQKLRCNTCGDIFTAEAPEGVGTEKYDATSCAMVAVFKYGTGVPFYRMERLQANLGIPLPASTQWEMVLSAAQRILPVFNELIRQASDGDVLYNDDTSVKILEFLKHNRVIEDKDFPGRTGVFTTGIVSTRDGRKIALFFSGRKHAGENLADVLAQRARELSSDSNVRCIIPESFPPIESDPRQLSRSRPATVCRSRPGAAPHRKPSSGTNRRCPRAPPFHRTAAKRRTGSRWPATRGYRLADDQLQPSACRANRTQSPMRDREHRRSRKVSRRALIPNF